MRTILLLCILGVSGIGFASYSLADVSDPRPTKHSEHNVKSAPQESNTAQDATRTDSIRRYVVEIMQGWAPAKIEMAPLEDVAESIAKAAVSDEPAWPDDKTGARSAVLLASLAYFEGARFAKYVDDQTCNERSFQQRNPLAHYGTCDHRLAFSLWQIHEIELSNPHEVASASALKDRDFAAHIALRLARQSLAATGTLRNYTGEWSGPCPKAEDRLSFAEKAFRAHPFQP